jgi:hypothetical protein
MRISKKRTNLFAGFVLCLTTGAVVAYCAPEISVDTATYDLGTIYEGKRDSAMHTFKVKNTGDTTLVIRQVKPG